MITGTNTAAMIPPMPKSDHQIGSCDRPLIPAPTHQTQAMTSPVTTAQAPNCGATSNNAGMRRPMIRMATVCGSRLNQV